MIIELKLIKTSFYTSLSTGISFLSGFIVTKVVAVKIGPLGMAFVGQFQNAGSIFTLLATAAIGTGVVKYLAQYAGRKEDQQKIITTGISVILISAIVMSALVMTGSGYLSRLTFHSSEYWEVFFLYGLFLIFTSFNVFFTSIYNGLKLIRTLTIVNITGSLAGIIFTVFFAVHYGVKGVLVASNFTVLVIFIVNMFFKRKLQFSFKPSFKNPDKKLMSLLFAFTLMAIVSGLVTPVIQILVRNRIITQFSAVDAGLWQGVSKISDTYLGFITTVLAVYYLPRYSEIKYGKDLVHEIGKGYRIILPAVGIMAFGVWLFRATIIKILFAPEFLPMIPLFKFQLLGDFFKIGSWLLAFIMLSKAMIKTFIITELVFSTTYVLWCFLFMRKYGVIGATYGFCLNYFIYWIVVALIIRKYIKANPTC